MLDQSRFMELLKEITEVAKVQENRITKEEIAEYFKGMDMTKEQFVAVYQYLGDNGITVPGFAYKRTEVAIEDEKEEGRNAGKEQIKSVAHRLYLEELEGLETLTQQEKTRLFLAMRNGQKEAKGPLLKGYLPVVAALAEKYKNKGIPVEDLIQEGNIGLLQALDRVSEIAKVEDADTFLVESVRKAMVDAVDEEIGANDWESSVLAKSGLINEAAKYLAEDLGRVATLQELAEYTKLSEKEIEDIRKLSLDAIEVGKGE